MIDAFRRMFTRSRAGASVSPEQAQIRVKALKGQLARNKSEAKRLYSQVEKANLSPDKKAAHKARLKELDEEKAAIRKEMKALKKRLPSK